MEGPRQIARSDRQFALTVSDERFQAAMAVVERWRSRAQPSYNLNRRNCIHFVARDRRGAGSSGRICPRADAAAALLSPARARASTRSLRGPAEASTQFGIGRTPSFCYACLRLSAAGGLPGTWVREAVSHCAAPAPRPVSSRLRACLLRPVAPGSSATPPTAPTREEIERAAGRARRAPHRAADRRGRRGAVALRARPARISGRPLHPYQCRVRRPARARRRGVAAGLRRLSSGRSSRSRSSARSATAPPPYCARPAISPRSKCRSSASPTAMSISRC